MYQDIYNCICQNTKNKIYYPLCQIYSSTNKGMFLLRVLIRDKHFDTDCHQVLEKVPCVWKQEPHQVQDIVPSGSTGSQFVLRN